MKEHTEISSHTTRFADLEYVDIPPTAPGWYVMRFKRPWQSEDEYEYRIVCLSPYDPIGGEVFNSGVLHVVNPPTYRARVNSVWSDNYAGWEWTVNPIIK